MSESDIQPPAEFGNDEGGDFGGARTITLQEFDEWGSGDFQLHECGYLPEGRRWHHNQVCDPFWRFYSNARKGNFIETDGRCIPIKPDEVMVIPENTLFNARGGIGVPQLWIHFSPPLALRLGEGKFCLPLREPLAGNIRELQRLLLGDPRTKIERHRVFHACLAILHSCFAQAALEIEQPPPPALSAVLETIERSLSRPLSNDHLARQAGMSRDGFIRWFKAHMETTPARYVSRRRIREACRLLSLTSRSIDDIAEAVGFANRHHFTRLFVRQIGRGPAEFRRHPVN